MISLFLDSNIWLRLYLEDQKEQYQSVLKLFQYIESGEIRPYTSTIVVLEVNFVLKSYYHLPTQKTLQYLNNIRSTKNISIIEETDLDKALIYYKKYGIKFTDCIIASQIRKGLELCTYDRDFIKIKEVKSCPPDVIIKAIE